MKTLALLIGSSLLSTMICRSQNSENRFTDAELIQLVSHIKNLEAQNNTLHINVDFKKLENLNTKVKTTASSIKERSNSEFWVYSDSEVIKLANYIKELENNLKNTIVAEEQYKTALAEAKK